MAINSKIETELVDPKDRAKLEKAILSGSEAPTVRDQTPSNDIWRIRREQPGPPFDAERITIAEMRQIRKDPMVAFSLHYRKVPMARANFRVRARDKNGPNAQVAAFYDRCLRMIYVSYIMQRTLTYDFGYSPMVKQWREANPGGVYADYADRDEATGLPNTKPVWDEGSVLPIIWKEFVALLPERSFPRFIESGVREGEFDGIDYELPQTGAGTGKGKSSRTKSKGGIKEISVYNSLWTTFQKYSEHGSLYGYPLIAFARDYWWDYQFVAGLQRRAFERIALPPIKAYYPKGSTVVDETTGERQMNWQIAIEMAERMRSNAIAAVPSEMAAAGLDQAGSKRAWDFEYMETPTENFQVFDRARNYYNVMKLRATWTPEMAVIGRESGNSGGNIANQMQELFFAGLELDMKEILLEFDKYVGPQLLIKNFPEFVANGGKCETITDGFSSEDTDLLRQVLQLFGQSNPEILADIDTHDLLQRAGMPLKDPAVLAAERQYLIDQGMTLAPPITGLIPGEVSTIANPNVNPGFTNGGSAPNVTAGFSDDKQDSVIYINPPEEINLDESEVDDFLSGLPASKHYSDKTIRALAVQLRRLWSSHFRRLYPEFAKYLAKSQVNLDDKFEFNAEGLIELANKRRQPAVSKSKAEKIAKKLVKEYGFSSSVLNELRERSAVIIRKMIKRGIALDMRDAKLDAIISDDVIESFLESQTNRLVKLTHQTMQNELRDYLIREIMDGKSTSEIADNVVARFETMPTSKAERVARSETRDAVNAATLIASEGAEIKYVKARDGEDFDEECRQRNNTLMTIREAWKQMRKEHPYGTLGFEPIPRANFSINPVYNGKWPEDKEDVFAYFDDDTSTVYYKTELSEDHLNAFLDNLSERLINE